MRVKRPPEHALTPSGAAYPFSQDADGRWRLHHAGGSQVVNGLAGAMRLAQAWERANNPPPRIELTPEGEQYVIPGCERAP
jgi:hypothetical protein